MSYRVLQLTNNNIGTIAVGSNMPLGRITRKLCCGNVGTRTFDISTSNADTVTLNEKGNYNVLYNVSFIPSGAEVIKFTLYANDVEMYSVSRSVAAATTYNITLPYQVRVLDNCPSCTTNNPLQLQLRVSGVGVASGSSNLLIEKVY